jgi:predicted transcriptional regulator
MTKKKKPELEKPLTEVELELMNAIWELGTCNVKDVQKAVSQKRDLAYTSVATMMKILEEKGALQSDKGERVIVYKPLLSREEYGASSLRHLASNVFQGNPTSMVMKMLDDSELSREELQALRKIIEARMK